jgi:hypothetical protein
MEISELENRLKKLTEDINKETFIYDLLLAYDFPKATISRLRNGDLNLSKDPTELNLKKKLFFKYVTDKDPHIVIDELSNRKDIKQTDPRFIIVSNFELFLSLDTKTKDTLDIPINELYKNFDFYFPWIGKEKTKLQNESLVDIKAARKMGQLYDSIIQENKNFISSKESRHVLNIFFARLLFCLFSEDTGIFKDGIFTNCLASHTSEDGSDLKKYLEEIFLTLNKKDNFSKAQYLQDFPFVNGGLFKDDFEIPNFSRKSRQIIIESGQLDWGGINPDIFGSMVQAISEPEERSDYGVHYTSVTNILKVINPLFMDELNRDFDEWQTEKDLEKILGKIYQIIIFDPACGSGNFLIISYKQLCNLEIKIFEELQSVNPSKWKIASSGIQLNQFYGITLNDFDAEIAKLSLWLSQHQMNIKFKEVFGDLPATLPLRETGNILCGNSTRISWDSFCKKDKGNVYILGNPPYLGFSLQNSEQKEDIKLNLGGASKLDYISIWFLKASSYIKNTNFKFAFVTTNSINQGEQISLLWPSIFKMNLEIYFAYTSFKWTNNAVKNAAVSCNIIGIASRANNKKFIYTENIRREVNSISPYLTANSNSYVTKRSTPLSNFPIMMLGDMAKDGGNLVLSKEEKNVLLKTSPQAKKYIKRFIGAIDLIRGEERWCLWISEEDFVDAAKIPFIKDRFNKVSQSRLASEKVATQEYANKPYRFVEIRYRNSPSILIPTTSSELREYIPIGFIDKDSIVTAPNQAIYDPPTYLFAVVSSKMHMIWVKAVGGKLKNDIRYSSVLCYNTFPFPDISLNQKNFLEESVHTLLDVREKYSNHTLSKLYDKQQMPDDLKLAHKQIDSLVESCYRKEPFISDEERLEYLFNMYESLINKVELFYA